MSSVQSRCAEWHTNPEGDTDTDTDFENRRNQAYEQALEHHLATCHSQPQAHENWTADNMDVRTPTTGLRIATYNFERKLYTSKSNIIDCVNNMAAMKINVLVCTEPGQASNYNINQLMNTVRRAGFDAKLSYRCKNRPHGGIVLITDQAWSKIPAKVNAYEPSIDDLKSRLMSVTFDNNTQGQHNKLQIIWAHLLNTAHTKRTDTAKLLTWACKEKTAFHNKHPKAPTILIGGLNAAQDAYLDTDRDKSTLTIGQKEEDAYVLDSIKDLRLKDVLRLKFPKLRATTRTVQHQTNRLSTRQDFYIQATSWTRCYMYQSRNTQSRLCTTRVRP